MQVMLGGYCYALACVTQREKIYYAVGTFVGSELQMVIDHLHRIIIFFHLIIRMIMNYQSLVNAESLVIHHW